jgi:hypothetical protein
VIRPTLSDRERDGLHGPVKSVADEYSTTVFDRDGKILEWSGNTSHGRVERKYVYDQSGRLVRISGSNGDWVDEFRYDERSRKTRIRRVPARPEQGSRAYGIGAAFDAVSEGEIFDGGGRVETAYTERDQPLETKILDDEEVVLFRIVYTYGANGRLSEEKMVTENLPLPKAFRDQIPPEHRAAVLEQMKAQRAEISQRNGLSGDAERSYVYDHAGNMVERHMRRGSIREDITWRYNQRGDAIEWTRTAGGFPHPTGEISEPSVQCAWSYEYDEHGNWKSRTESTRVGETETARIHVRQLTYHD